MKPGLRIHDFFTLVPQVIMPFSTVIAEGNLYLLLC